MPQTTAVGVSVRCPLRISYGGTKGTPKKNDRESKNSCFVNFRRGSHGVTLWMRRAKESRRALRRSASTSLTISGRSELATAAMYSSVRRCHTPLDKNFCQWNLNSQWRGRSPCFFLCSIRSLCFCRALLKHLRAERSDSNPSLLRHAFISKSAGEEAEADHSRSKDLNFAGNRNSDANKF